MFAQKILDQLFKRLDTIEVGSLAVTTPDGKERFFSGKNSGQKASIHLHDWRVVTNIMQKGDIGFAEDYRAGKWDTNDLNALMILGLQNRQAMDRLIVGSGISQIVSMLSYFMKLNTLKGSKKNIHAHYDLGNEFYQLWLDPSMTYSSGIYKDPSETLMQAQHNKYDRILNCLNQTSGQLLEIGCGWGGFAERAQQAGDFDIKGITLSQEQHDYARKRLGEGIKIELEDYRHQQSQYDHIVSIEMFEAVGERYWKTYFSKIADLLSNKGKAVIQTITMNEYDFPLYRRSGDFIRSFIFPGGMLPSPSRFKQEAQRAGLRVEDEFYFGQDYARTLDTWLEKFDQQKDKIKALGFDEGFIRLWRLYLAACSAGFTTERTNVMQVELSII